MAEHSRFRICPRHIRHRTPQRRHRLFLAGAAAEDIDILEADVADTAAIHAGNA